MAWTSNTKDGWCVVHEEKVSKPFKDKEAAMKAMDAINAPPKVSKKPKRKKK